MRTVRHFQYIEWPEQGPPKSAESFIDFIHQVIYLNKNYYFYKLLLLFY